VVLLVLAVVVVALLSFPAPGPTAIDTWLASFIKDFPGLLGWFWEISYDLLLAWALLLLALALFSRGRKRLLVDELLAAALALGFALLAVRVAGTDWGSSFSAVGASGSPPIYLAVRLALATAVVVVASPYMARPIRYIGRWVVGIGAFAGIAVGSTLPIGMAAGFFVGIGTAAIVHLLFGSPAGRLTLDQVAGALADIDVDADDLQNAPFELRGVSLVSASAPDGRSLLVKIYGRDALDGQLLASAWSSLWYRGATSHVGRGRREQVEHEAFITLLAERGGVPVLPVVAAGMASENDALLVTETTGRPLRSLDPGKIDDELLGRIWRGAIRLHDLGVAHGRLEASRIVIRPDGAPAFGDFGDAEVAATDVDIKADRAQLLIATALVASPERAVSAALAALGRDGLEQVLPFLQPAVVDRQTRREIHERQWNLGDLRKQSADAAGVELPKPAQIRRVTAKSIGIVALVALLTYFIVSTLADVGLSNLIDELKGADWIWLVAALLLSPVIQVAQTFGTIGASIRPVRFLPVLMLEYAVQFVALALPSSAARVALDVRFFGRNGIDSGGAVSIGVIDSVCGFVIQILLIVVISLSGLATLDLTSSTSSSSSSSTSGSFSSGGHHLLILAVVLVVLGVIVTLAVPKYRRALREAIPKYRAMLRSEASSAATALRVLRMPSKLGLIFGGNLASQMLQAIVLGLCLLAFGQHATMSELILVNTMASLFAGFMPVPGGMGVAEAAYTAGLVAIGVPNAAAMSTAIAFRIVTYYLPPIWGAAAMRWLRSHSYL
jgi:uncharacterized protein (TIRG00374 family)